jgi:hypothetical protein
MLGRFGGSMRIASLVVTLAVALPAQTATYAVFSQPSLALEPPNRDQAHMAYDEARGRVLLAGGRPPGGGGGYNIQDTWEWNGVAWQQIFPATQLNFSKPMRIVYAPQRSQIIAVTGDSTVGGPPMQVHGWTGTNWVLVDANGPPSRADTYQIAWDGQRGVLVMFGAPFTPQTWEWNGLIWQQRSNGGPMTRSAHRMVYDEARQRVVLYGGIGYQNNYQLTDTWEWNGTYWLEHFGVQGPPAAFGSAIAYDRARQRVVLHGGYHNGNATGGVFEWNGTSWLTRTTSGGPGTMEDASMAFVPTTNRMLLFGGIHAGQWQRTRTIAFVTGSIASTSPHQPGCLGPVGVPTLAAVGGSRPVLGTTVNLRFTNLPNTPVSLVFAALATDDQNWGAQALPVDLTPLGYSSCLLRVAPEVIEPLSNLGGFANWNIAVPATPTLDGAQFFLQGLVLTPGFNPGGGVTSSSLRLVTGVL